jgi:predicted O-methyltransferase YrrM
MNSEKIGQRDPFASILAGTGAHREKHGCWAYPFGNGPLLGVIAATKEARRIVEFGTALGYSALWFAYGSQRASVDTIDKDPEHVRLAQNNINQAGFADRIRIHQGNFLEVSRTFQKGYDLAFFDGHSPTLADLAGLKELLRPGGVLITTNLLIDGGESLACRKALSGPDWLTTPIDASADTVVSVLR